MTTNSQTGEPLVNTSKMLPSSLTTSTWLWFCFFFFLQVLGHNSVPLHDFLHRFNICGCSVIPLYWIVPSVKFQLALLDLEAVIKKRPLEHKHKVLEKQTGGSCCGSELLQWDFGRGGEKIGVRREGSRSNLQILGLRKSFPCRRSCWITAGVGGGPAAGRGGLKPGWATSHFQNRFFFMYFFYVQTSKAKRVKRVSYFFQWGTSKQWKKGENGTFNLSEAARCLLWGVSHSKMIRPSFGPDRITWSATAWFCT